MSATETATPIWDFVLGYYRQQGVSDAAIALQDSIGIDVNMVLFLMWMAAQNKTLAAPDVKTVSDTSHAWQRSVVVPIRAIRRLLKSDAPLVDNDSAQAYRKKVQALELEGEQLQLNAMASMAGALKAATAASPGQAARENLAALQSAIAKQFPPATVDTFVRALEGAVHGR
jgi:uncharacterized protein (TIGR02444 family)